jgi:hypothetical protein
MPTLERAKLYKYVWSLRHARFQIAQAQILTPERSASVLEIHGFRG